MATQAVSATTDIRAVEARQIEVRTKARLEAARQEKQEKAREQTQANQASDQQGAATGVGANLDVFA